MTARSPRLRVPITALALILLAALAVGAHPEDAAADARTTIHRVTVPAGHFVPAGPDMAYQNDGFVLSLNAGQGFFTAPVPYHYDGTDHVFFTRVELLGVDGTPNGTCLTMYRAQPGDFLDVAMGDACAPTAGPGSAVFVPSPRRVNAGQRAYLWLRIGRTGSFYGARVTYTTNP